MGTTKTKTNPGQVASPGQATGLNRSRDTRQPRSTGRPQTTTRARSAGHSRSPMGILELTILRSMLQPPPANSPSKGRGKISRRFLSPLAPGELLTREIYELVRRTPNRSGISFSSVRSTLGRMEEKGWLVSRSAVVEGGNKVRGRRPSVYKLTKAGEQRLGRVIQSLTS